MQENGFDMTAHEAVPWDGDQEAVRADMQANRHAGDDGTGNHRGVSSAK